MKTIAHHLADLALDLKITLDVEMSSAELTRCIEKAVADYSRFCPREMSREITIDADVEDESFTTPTVSDVDYFVDNDDISAIDDGDLPTMTAYRPDVPRPVLVTVTDADVSITQLVIIVKGYDADNKYIEEFFYLEGGLVQTGEKYFALVTEVEIDEVTGEGAGDVIDVGTGAADGVYVQLDYKPIKLGTDAISGLALDTDYEMDYAGGRIAMKSGGSMVVNTAYTIDYTKSRLDIDLSTIIDDLIRVDRVEYPVGQVPQQFSKMEVWGNILTLTGGFESQAEVSDEEHLVIKYYVPHSIPEAQSPGSFPSYLDTTIQLAASAYALFIEALQYEQQAVTDLAAVRTELGLTDAIHVLADAALDKVATYVADADTALDEVIVYLTNNTNEDSKYWLTKLTTDIADLRTAVATAVDAANAYLDEVDVTDLAQATVGAEGLLETGDDLINVINVGENVPGLYAAFSGARVAIAATRTNAAMAYLNEAAQRIDNLRTYIEQADAWGRVADRFMNEAAGRLSMATAFATEGANRIAEIDRHLEEASQWNATAANSLILAEMFKAEGIERRNEAWAIWGSPNQIAANYALGQRGQLE